MNNHVIFLAGIHGVGKGQFSRYLNDRFQLPVYSASTLIKDEKNRPIDSSKIVLDPSENQDHLVSAIKKLNMNNQLMVLDGHFVLLLADSFFEVSISTFQHLPICHVILKIADVNLIHERLLRRDGKSLGVEVLVEFQRLELKRAKEVASILGVEVTIVDTEDYECVDLLKMGVDSWGIR